MLMSSPAIGASVVNWPAPVRVPGRVTDDRQTGNAAGLPVMPLMPAYRGASAETGASASVRVMAAWSVRLCCLGAWR